MIEVIGMLEKRRNNRTMFLALALCFGVALGPFSCSKTDKGDPSLPWDPVTSGGTYEDDSWESGDECASGECGGNCGECPYGQTCFNGLCISDGGDEDTSCEPDCWDRECGPDGCGGQCGACESWEICSYEGECYEPCEPDCDGRVCGDDGCGGSCGTCQGDWECVRKGTFCLEPGHTVCMNEGSPCGPNVIVVGGDELPPPPDDVCGPGEFCVGTLGVCAPDGADICSPMGGWCSPGSECRWKCELSDGEDDESGWTCCDPGTVKDAVDCAGNVAYEMVYDDSACEMKPRACQACCGKSDYPVGVFHVGSKEYSSGGYLTNRDGKTACCSAEYPYPCPDDWDSCCKYPEPGCN